MSIGERLKLIRKESGLNQTEFGARISLSQTTIGLYESDNRVVTDRAISQICATFNINERWLKTGEGEMRRTTNPLFLKDSSLDAADREILESYIRMTPTQRQFIKDWIRNIAQTITDAEAPPAEKRVSDAERAEMHHLLDAELDAEEKARSASEDGNAKRA